jgi:L-seryl-tRNA(Ser) seleniumtransferase
MSSKQNLFRKIPKVDALLSDEKIAAVAEKWKPDLVQMAIDDVLSSVRQEIAEGLHNEISVGAMVSAIPDEVVRRLEDMTAPSFLRVINATGVVVHTNLGRSPLPRAALERIAEYAGGYMTLEFDIDSGKRGNRDDGVRRLLKLLFPGREAIVVNNNAAAVLLAMNTLSADREAIISRGRIIEIGDGFRINQIQEKSGARLREVGTTNRTHIDDFEQAVCEHTALLLSVHPSNYRVVGFTADVSLEELVELGREHSLPVVEDWGSGCLVDPQSLGISNEESAEELLRSRPDAICFSGDKLLGGPQAGIIVGKPDVIRKMRTNHLYRALRVDKLTLLALEEVLRLYLQEKEEDIPTIRMLRQSREELQQRSETLAGEIGQEDVTAVPMTSRVGGGAAPEIDIPSYGLKIKPLSGDAEALRNRLRFSEPPVIARVVDDELFLDLRTVFPADESALLQVVVDSLR